MYNPKKKTHATVEYVDVPGVAKGEGSALVDLPALRGIDALVHVVRAFESDVVPHPDGSVDPLRDAKMLELELILADLAAVEKRLERLEANIKKANKADDVAERAVFLKMKEALEAERPLRELELPEEDRRRLRSYCVPLREAGAARRQPGRGRRSATRRATSSPRASTAFAARPGFGLCPVSATIEAEMSRAARRGREGLPGGPGPHGAGPRPRDPHVLRAPGPHLVPDRGRGRVPRLDDPEGDQGPAGRRRRSTPTSSAASSAPRSWPSTT